jgi:hypothetical protein
VLAGEIDAVVAGLREQGEEPVLAGGIWSLPGEIGFYCRGQPHVYSLGRPLGDRHSQYDLWHPNPVSEPERYLSKTFVVIGSVTEKLQAGFDQVEPTRVVTYTENGQIIAVWTITVARGYRGFPMPTTNEAF